MTRTRLAAALVALASAGAGAGACANQATADSAPKPAVVIHHVGEAYDVPDDVTQVLWVFCEPHGWRVFVPDDDAGNFRVVRDETCKR